MSWTHPIHARGVKSPRYDSAHVGPRLSDKQIDQYAREGRYGDEMQQRVVASDTKKTKKQPSLFARAMKELRRFNHVNKET